MDINENTTETENINFGKEIVKEFATSTAVSAGAWTGILVVCFAVGKFNAYRDARNAQKDPATQQD